MNLLTKQMGQKISICEAVRRSFRWDINVEGCFPDSCMKYDAIEDGWRVGNIRNLQCQHVK